MKRLLSILLTATFVIVLIAITLPGASAASESVIVVAGSDFRHVNGNTVGFNCNSRGVINGYKDGAESFTIYKFTGDFTDVEE